MSFVSGVTARLVSSQWPVQFSSDQMSCQEPNEEGLQQRYEQDDINASFGANCLLLLIVFTRRVVVDENHHAKVSHLETSGVNDGFSLTAGLIVVVKVRRLLTMK